MNSPNKTTATSMDEILAATKGFKSVRAKMNFLIPSTESERLSRRRIGMGAKSRRVLENRLQAARQYRDLLPPAFDLRNFEKDTEISAALSGCLACVNQVREELLDTLTVVGGRAQEAATVAYGHIKISAAGPERLKRTVDTLASRGRARPAAPAEHASNDTPSPATPLAQDAAPSQAPVNPANPANPSDRAVA